MTSEEIKQSMNMTEVISGMYGIPIRNNMCRCPFHDDRSPSMRVYRDSAYCFTCGKSWDVFSFVMDRDGLSFKEAFIALGGTYEHSNNKAEELAIKKKREMHKAEIEQANKERKRQFKEVSDALLICDCGIKTYEPYSDEWCYYVNARTYILYVFDAIFLDGSEEYDLDVHRKCQEIRSRCFC